MRTIWPAPGGWRRGDWRERGAAHYDAATAIILGLAAVLALVQSGRSITRGAGTDGAILFGVAVFLCIAVIRKVARLRRPSAHD
ncbi:MAG: hypothetical protein GX774_05010 [Armatimonadetes bacterium]|jgi:hypothetical protein|nr:hypothetical protein [Armatimonadota bacterium]